MPHLRGEVLPRSWRGLLWLASIAAVLLAAQGVAAWVAPTYSYDRWDNFEYYTPMIAVAHRMLLSGELPMWNPHQHLGESFVANPQMGAFYPPYTLAYALVAAFSLDVRWLCALITIVHSVACGWGNYVLARELGVRPSLAAVGALGVASGGYLHSVSAVWVFVGPTFAWLPWTLWGALRLLAGNRRIRDGAVFVAGLAAQAYVGHPQIWVYVWLCVGLCCLGFWLVSAAPINERLWRGGRLLLHGLAAVALGLLTMLPVLMQTRHTARRQAVSFADFVYTSASVDSLRGLLLPFYRSDQGFITEEPCSFLLHQGAWLVPALVLGAASAVRAERGGGPDRALARRGLVFALVGGLLLVFALGKNTPIYPLTYTVPVWSSFRWPHKFLMVALPCVGVAGTVGLELIARAAMPSLRRRAGIAAAFAILVIIMGRGGWADVSAQPLGVWGLAAGGVGLLAAPFVGARLARGVLLAVAVASAPISIALAHFYTPNAFSAPHVVDWASYGWSPEYRVLPVHRDRSRAEPTSRLLFTSATLLGLQSVTGCTTAMAPEWYTSWLPSNYLGLLPDKTYRQLLPSHFLRSLNVRYVVAPSSDRVVDRWMQGARLERRIEIGALAHYEVPGALPRTYFASELHEYTPEAFRQGLWENRADARAAYVEGLTGSERIGAGQILEADFGRASRPRLEVDSPAGGFVVISSTWAPEWRAFVDGVEVSVRRTNAMLQGVSVPAGRHGIEMRYEHPGFRWGLRSAAGGVVSLAILWAPWRRWANALKLRLARR